MTEGSRGASGREKMRGVVANFLARKGYGFIRTPEGENVFVHYSHIKSKARKDYRTLVPGEEVEFYVTQDERGLQAREVVRLNPPPEGRKSDAPAAESRDKEPGGTTRTW